MVEQLISFETAKLAKEKGFNNEGMSHSCDYLYASTGKEIPIGSNQFWSPDLALVCSAPTQSLLQKWLRETHSLDILITKPENGYWDVYIWGETRELFSPNECAKSYEEALEQGLQEALKLI